MQAKGRLLRTILAVLVISLALGACSGGAGGGSTWFNLPSIPVTVDANGNGTVLGFPIGQILQQSLLDQFAVAGVDVLEVRIGYHGVFLYADGTPLPYLSWNDESIELLGQILTNVQGAEPAVPALPWLRRVGTGVVIILPTAGSDIPRWQGEELASPESLSETTIGPLQIGSLAYDENGKASIEGIALSEIEQALGSSFGLDLPPLVLQIVQGLGAQQLTISTQPNGIDLSIDNKALPSIAYDTSRLNNVQPIASAFVDPSMGGMVADIVPQLPGADLDIIVSFSGEPAAETQIASIPIKVNDEGLLTAWGIPLGTSPILQPEVFATLGGTNIQRLDVNIKGDSLFLALNQQPLPVIAWSNPTLETFESVGGELLNIAPGVLGPGLSIVRSIVEKTDIGMSLGLPVPAGQEALDFAADYDVTTPNFASAETTGAEPALQIGVSIDENGRLQSVGGIPLTALEGAGIPAIDLPPVVLRLLNSIGTDNLQVTTSGNALELTAGDNTLLGLQYDEAALHRTLDLASALMDDPSTVQQIGGFLPRLLGSGINVQVALGGQPAAETKLSSLPVEVKADGSLALFGFPLGDQSILQPQFIIDMQDLNIQRLDLNIIDDSLYLASNGETLPVISWSDQSLDTIQQVVGELTGVSPDLLEMGMAFLKNADVGVALSLPPAAGAEVLSMPDAFDMTAVQMEPPAIDIEHRPVLSLGLTVSGSEIQSIAGLPAAGLRELGVYLPSLPPNIASILYNGLEVEELELMSMANQLNVMTDNEIILTLQYDAPSIHRTLKLASPFLPEHIMASLDDPNISALLLDNLLPLLVSANLDLTAELTQP